jgi:hypothetical protein
MRVHQAAAFLLMTGYSIVPTLSVAADEPIVASVTKLRSVGSEVELALTNHSHTTITYYHWLGQGNAPVPYCRDGDGATYVCAKVVHVDPEGALMTHEDYLAPGKTVHFLAKPKGTSTVGVRLWVSGHEQYVWVK